MSKRAGPLGYLMSQAEGRADLAILFAIDIDDHFDRLGFLRAYSEGDLSEWPEFKTFCEEKA